LPNKIIFTSVFARKVKPLLKKYRTLASSLTILEEELMENPRAGSSYGANIYKVRLSDPSKGKGKSGGFRVITYLIVQDGDDLTIQVITILDKSEESSISKEDVLRLIAKCGLS
jgi:mRNA-degrading endonuclease RelE of RelBE toxin-antitoxin system